jgi:hypothetical protein
MVQDVQVLERESLEKEHNIKADSSVVMAVRDHKSNKMFKKFMLRNLYNALARWKDTL